MYKYSEPSIYDTNCKFDTTSIKVPKPAQDLGEVTLFDQNEFDLLSDARGCVWGIFF